MREELGPIEATDDSEGHYSPEHALWAAVLKTYVTDAYCARVSHASKRLGLILLECESPWVRWICAQLGVDHGFFMMQLKGRATKKRKKER